MRTLRRLGVRVIICEEESNVEIVKCLQQMPGAYAILGNDSDFFLMRGARFVPLQHLRVDDGRVLARVFTPESVAAALGLPEPRLHELAALCGNDITAEFIDRHCVARALGLPTVRSRLRGERCHPVEVAAFLRRLPPATALRDEPRLAPLLTADPAFAAALRRNEDFYHAPPRPEPAPVDAAGEGTPLEGLLRRGMRACRLPAWVLAVHRHRHHYCGPKAEAMSPAPSPVDAALNPLRRVTYTLITPPSPRSAAAGRGAVVTEHVRAGHGRVPRPLQTVSPRVLLEAAGHDDLLGLQAEDVPRRCAALLALLWLCADPPRPPPSPAQAAADCALAAALAAAGPGIAARRAGVVVLIRALLLLRLRREGGAAAASGARTEARCVATMALVLHCCAESEGGDGGGLLSLPEIVPSAGTVEMASLWLAVVDSVSSLAQLLNLDRWS